MPSSKPSYAEIYAWNEPVLSIVAVAWGLYIAFFFDRFVPSTVLGIVISIFGLALLCVQSPTVRLFIDFTAPAFTATRSPKFLRPYILKIWPMSVIVRIICHFFFTWWWAVLSVSIASEANEMHDVRFVLYAGFSLMHADRLTRIIQWMRK